MTRPRHIRAAILAAAVALLIGAHHVRAQLLPDGYPHRRPLTFTVAQSDAPGDNLAVAEFYTNGTHQPDGSDIRITTDQRLQVPARVLQVSKDHDLVRVAFATRGKGPQTYYAWWGRGGNPKPDKNAPALTISRGVLAESFRHPGGPADNEAQLRKLFDKAKDPNGATFVATPAIGFDPLGGRAGTLVRYTAPFRLSKETELEIAFGADDRGLLTIDGKTVDFARGVPGDARHAKTLKLAAGWHTLEILQANTGAWESRMLLAWRKKGEGKYEHLPAALFAPVATATPGPLETIGQPYTADFTLEEAAEAFVPPNDYLQRYTFEARIPAAFKPEIAWTFSDGQSTRDLRRVHHIFMTPGVHSVTLSVQQAGKTFSTTQRIPVGERMLSRFPQPPHDPAKTVQAVLEKYNPAKLPAEARLRGMLYFRKHKLDDHAIPWGLAWAAAKDTQPDNLVASEAFDLGQLLLEKGKPAEAAQMYQHVAAKDIGPAVRAEATRHAVMVLCDALGDAPAADKLLQQALKNTPDSARPARHVLQTAAVYAAIAKGDGKTAAKLADDIGTRKNKPFNQQQIDQGVLTRNIESYIRTEDHDTATKLLNQWESDYPEAMLDGYSRLLRVKLLLAQDRPAEAARIAVQHATALPDKFYAAELLYRAHEAYTKANKPEEAHAALEKLKSKYPESPYATTQPTKPEPRP